MKKFTNGYNLFFLLVDVFRNLEFPRNHNIYNIYSTDLYSNYRFTIARKYNDKNFIYSMHVRHKS